MYVRLEMDLRGDTRFVEVAASSKASPCRVMSCYVEGVGPHSDCRLASEVREGSGKSCFQQGVLTG